MGRAAKGEQLRQIPDPSRSCQYLEGGLLVAAFDASTMHDLTCGTLRGPSVVYILPIRTDWLLLL
jgi:hypothetical protein